MSKLYVIVVIYVLWPPLSGLTGFILGQMTLGDHVTCGIAVTGIAWLLVGQQLCSREHLNESQWRTFCNCALVVRCGSCGEYRN